MPAIQPNNSSSAAISGSPKVKRRHREGRRLKGVLVKRNDDSLIGPGSDPTKPRRDKRRQH